jgi:basic amino acid/polyamine antiporter, APA family
VSEYRNYSLPNLAISGKVSPKKTLSLRDAIALIIGVVIGAGIFETPSLVADNIQSPVLVILVWLLGGVMSLIGALCYAELATTYPHSGGNYHYLMRAFGKNWAFLFAWARLAVVQTGSIALLAFVFGDYASQLWRLGDYSPSIYAAGVIIFFTAVNILGIQQGKSVQNWLTVAQVIGLLLVVMTGLIFAAPPAMSTPPPSQSNFGLAMVFVLLSYGGWNEAAYISAELRNVKRNMVRSLLWSLTIITVIYLLINLAYILGLGLEGMASSEAVAADLMRRAFGKPGAVFISFLITIATLSAINATIFTGARTNYALGQDFALFSFMGGWKNRSTTLTNALLLQAVITLFLVVLGTVTRRGFETMVDYTAPIFWFFFLLSSLSLLVLRVREPEQERPFQVPFYPLTPLLFCFLCGYLLYSSLAYTGIGGMIGVSVVLAGVPLLFITCHRSA